MSIDNNISHDTTIAVVGATGQQGGATADALLTAGASVRALVRDVDSAPARHLAGIGAELVMSALDRPESLVDAFAGVDAIFAMTTFAGPAGPTGEVEHGRAIAEAARAAGVDRVVYSSVGGAERETGIPHFESKRRVEEHFEALGLTTTFIRPTFFMDNFLHFSKPTVEDGTVVVRLPLPGGIPLQMVAVRDIGRAAARALLFPGELTGGAVEIAGDELTGEQIAAVFGDSQGMPARYEALPIEALAGNADQQAMFSWFAQSPAYLADFAASRALVPDLLDLHTWVEQR